MLKIRETNVWLRLQGLLERLAAGPVIGDGGFVRRRRRLWSDRALRASPACELRRRPRRFSRTQALQLGLQQALRAVRNLLERAKRAQALRLMELGGKRTREELVLLTPDYWQPERILARAAAPYVLVAFAISIIGAQVL